MVRFDLPNELCHVSIGLFGSMSSTHVSPLLPFLHALSAFSLSLSVRPELQAQYQCMHF